MYSSRAVTTIPMSTIKFSSSVTLQLVHQCKSVITMDKSVVQEFAHPESKTDRTFRFQVIELDYSEADQDSTGEEAANTEKQLVYYQLDLGLNHVTRLWSDPISR